MYQKYNRSKLKSLNLVNKSWNFNFNVSFFWYPLRYSVEHYLIGKLLDMLQICQESLVLASPLKSFKTTSRRMTIYYINGGLSELNVAHCSCLWLMTDEISNQFICPCYDFNLKLYLTHNFGAEIFNISISQHQRLYQMLAALE